MPSGCREKGLLRGHSGDHPGGGREAVNDHGSGVDVPEVDALIAEALVWSRVAREDLRRGMHGGSRDPG